MKRLFQKSFRSTIAYQKLPFSQVVGIPKETTPNESRVSISPEGVKKLTKMGYKVKVAKSAGLDANFPDTLYAENGAEIVS